MRVAAIVPLSLAPPRRGDAVRIFALIAELAHSDDVDLFSATPPGSISIPSDELPVHRHWFIPSRRLSDARTALRSLRGLAYDSARFRYDVDLAAIPDEQFDVAYLQLPRALDIWGRLERRLSAHTCVADLQNDDADMWEQRSSTERLPWLRLACRVYARRAADRIAAVVESSRLVFCATDADKHSILRRNGAHPGTILVLPNGVDVEHFRRPAGTSSPTARVVFVGSLDVRMNQVAARLLLRNYWPAIRRLVPKAALTIAGRYPPPWLQSSAVEGVEVVSSPPDIRPYLWSAGALIAPFESGSGSKIKILEALAAGTPVIATRQAMQGIPAEAGKHYLLADSPDAAASAVRDVLRNPTLAEQLTAHGVELVARFDWREIGAVARRAMESIVSPSLA